MPKPIPFWKLSPSEKRKVREAKKAAKAAIDRSPTTDKDTPMIENPEVICGVAATKFDRLVGEIKSAVQKKDDAMTAHASAWKAIKDVDINADALKLVLKLDRQADDKRNHFLKAFDELRSGRFSYWENQPDLFQQPEEHAAAAEEAEDEGLAARDETETADGTALAAERAAPSEPAPANASDWSVDGAAADADSSLDQAGFVFAAGRTAGMEGKAAADNPHAEGTSSAAVWEKGRISTAHLAVEVESYNAGWAAQAEGVARDANPHAEGSDEAGQWAEGWDAHAKKAAKPKRTKPKAAPVEAETEEPALTGSNVIGLPGVAIPRTGGDVYADMTVAH